MKYNFTLYLLIAIISIGKAQKHDNVWIFGYSNDTPSELTGGTIIDFSSDTANIYTQNTSINLQRTNASISDTLGNLLFYTNGIYIANAEYDTMQNGLGLNPGQYSEDFAFTGFTQPQGALILPKPESSNLYYLFHVNRHWNDDPQPGEQGAYTLELNYTTVDMNGDNGLGEVIQKNILLVGDTLSAGMITAVRHANGRDWWVFIAEQYGNLMYRVLLTPNGAEVIAPQELDFNYNGTIGQAVFTPDGSKYVSYNTVSFDSTGQQFNIFDFDRCSGLLSNHRLVLITDSLYYGGIAVSPNSRYAYVSSLLYVYQFDLLADDIDATKDTVAIYDGFESPFATAFYIAQLAPDGKIYINAPNGVDVLHVIHEPDLAGDACQFEQHGVQLPTYNAFSMPNFPNYRLGHLEDSPCDTLRQAPTALFNYTQQDDTSFTFTDASFHDINSWLWEFGDGQFSTALNPTHVYDSNGVYEVCLTVENPRGVDTYCETIQILINGVDDWNDNIVAFEAWPNPASEILHISAAIPFSGSSLTLYSMDGKRALSQQLPDGGKTASVSIERLNAGVYILEVKDDEGHIWREKVVVQ